MNLEDVIFAKLLSLQNAVDELYTYMKQYTDSTEADVLWRLARATCDKAKSTTDKTVKKELMYDAFRAAELALKLGDSNFACHKVTGLMFTTICVIISAFCIQYAISGADPWGPGGPGPPVFGKVNFIFFIVYNV